ncbi:hypothetical protein [Pseudomonas jinjuensis]|uniref:Lipoprotein n=1 Tax=Pseudomonas jinjuensis TaxID=198616 RepID=A0A1H0FNE7_9PSED|nr:hypothetical protein [Pseudomonas jinjuensis]SDN95999.1 hypothetical protein SAMN05216193_106265 [Pseudomonas jinjuensis]
MRRIIAALLLFLPLTGCVVHEHHHDNDRYRGWKDRSHYDRPVPRNYDRRDHDRRDRDHRDRDWHR